MEKIIIAVCTDIHTPQSRMSDVINYDNSVLAPWWDMISCSMLKNTTAITQKIEDITEEIQADLNQGKVKNVTSIGFLVKFESCWEKYIDKAVRIAVIKHDSSMRRLYILSPVIISQDLSHTWLIFTLYIAPDSDTKNRLICIKEKSDSPCIS